MEEQNVVDEVVENNGVDAIEAQTPKTPELTKEEKAKLEKQREYFEGLARGAAFIQFILDDMNRVGFNRSQRRRFIKQMFNKQFSKELVEAYAAKVDQIRAFINEELPPEPDVLDEVVEEYKAEVTENT